MKRRLIRSLRINPRWMSALAGLTLVLGAYGLWTWPAHAEGSRTLYPRGIQGHRGNIEWRTSFYGNFLRRRSLFKIYVEAGEVLLLGSSAVGVEDGDILIYRPGRVNGNVGDETIPEPADFNCEAQRQATGNSAQGRITSRDEELAGPATITDTATASPGDEIPGAYIPCFYTAPETGIYHVIFFGPYGGDSNEEIAPTGEIDLVSPDNFNERQATSIAAWDVTVRSSLTSVDDISGRLFADYITQFMGGNPRPVYQEIYMITEDGYIYRNNLRTLDPDGFIVYSNDVGFLDTNDDPLFHDVVAKPGLPVHQANQLYERIGDTKFAPPTHLVFFSQPSKEALLANNIPMEPIAPEVSEFRFEGRLGDNDTYVGGGGTFFFTSNVAGLFQLVISRDGVDFDPTNSQNRVIRRTHSGGSQSLEWDGLDNSGDPFPPGLGYPAMLTLRAGELHFPILDPENSLEGGPTYELLNPPNGNCPSFNGSSPNCHIAFYDDRGYVTASGVEVGIPGEPLPGTNPPVPAFSDPLAGFDTRTDQRRFGDGSPSGFGDKKGLDLWTFYPSEPALATIDIYALNLSITKTDGGITTQRGEVVIYTLNYSNTSPIDATGVVITEVVPLYTSFNEAASAPTLWSCPDGSPAGTVCTTLLGTVPKESGGSVKFAITVSPDIPEDVTQIENVAVIADDGSQGDEPENDNIAPDTTPLEPPEDDDDNDNDNDNGDDDDDDDGEPEPTPEPQPTPTTDGGDENGNGGQPGDGSQPGEGGQPGEAGATPAAALVDAAGAPVPTLPVTLLPETGYRETRSNSTTHFLVSLGLLSLTFALTYYICRRRGNKGG